MEPRCKHEVSFFEGWWYVQLDKDTSLCMNTEEAAQQFVAMLADAKAWRRAQEALTAWRDECMAKDHVAYAVTGGEIAGGRILVGRCVHNYKPVICFGECRTQLCEYFADMKLDAQEEKPNANQTNPAG